MGNWVIARQKVLHCGDLSGQVKPVITYLPMPEMGKFTTNRKAKVALAISLYPELARFDASDPEQEKFLVKHADQWIRNVKGHKIVNLKE